MRRMADLMDKSAQSNDIRQLAASLLEGEAAGTLKKSHADTIFKYVQERIKYIDDVDQIETIQDAHVTLTNGFGDCDDMVILLGSLLRAVGFPVAIVAAQMTGFEDYNHVYLMTYTDQGFVSYDATNKEQAPGWSLPSDMVVKRLIMVIAPRGYLSGTDIDTLKNDRTIIEYYVPGGFNLSFWAYAAAGIIALYFIFKKK